MKARTTPAVKIDTPPPWNCGPGLMPGRPPSGVVSSQGTSLSWMNGTITKMPTMPKMMLGMAASISMAVPTTRATAGWTSTTSSSAMTSASGTAMTIATSVERNVPASASRAPYWLSTVDQATVYHQYGALAAL